jgi:hypothetical protein
MALGDLTKQIAQQALLSATREKEPAAPAPVENVGAVILGQINAMQKALKDDEELLLLIQNGAESVRVMEIFLPSPRVAVLTGMEAEHGLTRIISPVETLQLVARVRKVPPEGKPVRVALITPKPKDSSAR